MRLLKNLSKINQEIDKHGVSMTITSIGSGYQITAKKHNKEFKIAVTKHSNVEKVIQEILDGTK